DLGVLQPAAILADVPDRPGYSAEKYGKTRYGLVTAGEALKKSHNTSTVEAYKKIINEKLAENYLDKMNLNLTKDDKTNPSLALGTNVVSVEQNTSAFSTLGNKGEYADSYMIDNIKTNDGDKIYEHKLDAVDVFSPQAAYLTIDMM